MSEIECILPAGAMLGEGALWDAAGQALWWVDIKGRLIHRYDPSSGRNESWPAPHDVGSLALRARGGLIVAMKHGFYFFDPASGGFTLIAEPEADMPENRFNDGKPDRQGRFWAGSLHDPETAPTGGLYRLDPDLSCRRMAAGIGIPNSIAWSADDRVFYFADTMDRAIYAYDFDWDSGAIANRRVFCTMEDQPGNPDGSTVDAEGCLWNAQWDGWRVVRYDPGGRIERIVELPVQKPTSCMFGGPDLTTLYVTSAIWDLDEAALARQPLAGSLLAIEVGVRGLPEPRFAG